MNQNPRNEPAPNPKFTHFLRITGMATFPPDLGKFIDRWLEWGLDWDHDIAPAIRTKADQFRAEEGQTAMRAAFFDDTIRAIVQENHDFEQQSADRRNRREAAAKETRFRLISKACEDLHLARDWMNYDTTFPGHPGMEKLKADEAEAVKRLQILNLDPEKTYRKWLEKQPRRPTDESMAA